MSPSVTFVSLVTFCYLCYLCYFRYPLLPSVTSVTFVTLCYLRFPLLPSVTFRYPPLPPVTLHYLPLPSVTPVNVCYLSLPLFSYVSVLGTNALCVHTIKPTNFWLVTLLPVTVRTPSKTRCEMSHIYKKYMNAKLNLSLYQLPRLFLK